MTDTNQISEHFHIVKDNLACPCCNSWQTSSFWERLQILRWLVDKSFNFCKKGGGGYRCRDYNSSLPNFAPNSMHLLSRAADISSHGWSGVDKHFFVSQAFNLGFSVGVYDNWFHVDDRSYPVLFHGN